MMLTAQTQLHNPKRSDAIQDRAAMGNRLASKKSVLVAARRRGKLFAVNLAALAKGYAIGLFDADIDCRT